MQTTRTNLLAAAQKKCGWRTFILLAAAGAGVLCPDSMATAIMVDLGTASNFSVLAYSKISDTGGVSTITGDVGLSPTSGAAIGLTAGQVGGIIYSVDAFGPAGSVVDPGLLTTARNDLSTAFTFASGQSGTPIAGGDNQLGGKILTPGVFSIAAASTANLIGQLTLDAEGDPNAVFIIQTSSTLVTAPASSVVLINGAQACRVFWVVGSSAAIGTHTDFVGNILAYASIGLETGATLQGIALAENDAVNLDHNVITKPVCSVPSSVPDGGSLLPLMGLGLLVVMGMKKAFVPSVATASFPG